jgi:hypothetical protein
MVETKNAFKALNHAAVIAAIFAKPKELQHLSGASEVYGPALLTKGKGSNPDRYEAVLPKRQTEVGMADNVKEELSVAPSIDEPTLGQGTKRNAAQDEWSGIERDFLLALLALFSDQQH